MMIGNFKDVTETLLKRFEESPLGKQLENKDSDYDNNNCDEPLVDYADGEEDVVEEAENIEKNNYDDNYSVYKDGNELNPDTEYKLNGVHYSTDAHRRINQFSANLKEVLSDSSLDAQRNNYAQKIVGGEDRRDTDQGGHLIARVFGGDSGIGNLVAMDSRINQGDYKRMEGTIIDALGEGKTVKIDGKIYYDGESQRPDKISVDVEIDGKKTVYTFNNERDTSLLDDDNNIGKEEKNNITEMAEEKDGGYISSKIEEYGIDGKLEKTVYTVRDSENNRIEIPIEEDKR